MLRCSRKLKTCERKYLAILSRFFPSASRCQGWNNHNLQMWYWSTAFTSVRKNLRIGYELLAETYAVSAKRGCWAGRRRARNLLNLRPRLVLMQLIKN